MLEYQKQLEYLYGNTLWGKPAPSPLIAPWKVPGGIRIETGNLLWRLANFTEIDPDQKSMRDLFWEFLELANASDEEILVFAQKWGVLGICKCGEPAAHTASQYPTGGFEGCEIPNQEDWSSEPLDKYRHYARLMRAIVSLAYELHQLKPSKKPVAASSEPAFVFKRDPNTERLTVELSARVPERLRNRQEDWHIVIDSYPVGSLFWRGSDTVAIGRWILANVVNHWLGITAVHPFFWWGEEAGFVLKSRDDRSHLLPRLVIQLLLVVSGSPDYATCYRCKKPFLLRKGQSISGNSYCKDCGTKAARQDAAKRYYRKEQENPVRKKKKQLTPRQAEAINRELQKGKPVKEIAAKYKKSVWQIYKIKEGKSWKETPYNK